MSKAAAQFTSIGGQAVIEGVMMRSPHFVAVAVRKPDQKIALQTSPYVGLSQRFPLLKRPILRGIVTLLESMAQGVEAMSFSAEIVSESQEGQSELSSVAIAGSLAVAFLFGIGLFVVLPHILTVGLSSGQLLNLAPTSPGFHLIDGILKMAILMSYVYFIAFMKDIRRVFQYHGAEHQSIYAFEAGDDLTVENARKYSTLHPRCGTSFLLFLVLVSVFVFSLLFPWVQLAGLSPWPVLKHGVMILLKVLLMLPVAGLTYELVKVSAFRMDQPFFRILMLPGLLLQRLTTREPTDDQLEVALCSLRQVLQLEKSIDGDTRVRSARKTQIEVSHLGEVTWGNARVSEFLEN